MIPKRFVFKWYLNGLSSTRHVSYLSLWLLKPTLEPSKILKLVIGLISIPKRIVQHTTWQIDSSSTSQAWNRTNSSPTIKSWGIWRLTDWADWADRADQFYATRRPNTHLLLIGQRTSSLFSKNQMKQESTEHTLTKHFQTNVKSNTSTLRWEISTGINSF